MEAGISHYHPVLGGSSATKGFRRALSLLKELSFFRDGSANLTQLSRAAGLPKSTVHRLIGVLLEERLIERVPQTRHFRLGPLVYELGIAAAPPVDLRTICAPSLDRLAAAAGEAAFLNCCSGQDALCLDRREGSFGFQAIPVHIGNRRPLGVGSSSLALLATLPVEAATTVIAANAERYPRHRLTDQRVLEAVAVVRARGFAVTSGRIVPSFSGVAIGINGPESHSPIALSVIALTEQLTASRIDKVVAFLQREEKALLQTLPLKPLSPQAEREP